MFVTLGNKSNAPFSHLSCPPSTLYDSSLNPFNISKANVRRATVFPPPAPHQFFFHGTFSDRKYYCFIKVSVSAFRTNEFSRIIGMLIFTLSFLLRISLLILRYTFRSL